MLEGGCACGGIAYRLKRRPIFVHCCHCSWCQRETGGAFALNAMIEADAVETVSGTPEIVDTPSESGRGQKIARCPTCKVALWSNYADAGPSLRFVRVGSLKRPETCPPDIHIFTASKQPWVPLPDGVPAMTEFYDPRKLWPAESLARAKAARAAAKS